MPDKRDILVGTTVGEVMSTRLATADPGDSLYKVARIMRERRVSGLPVVGPDRTVLGIISERDLVRELHRASGIFSFRGILDLLLALDGIEGPERLRTAIQHLKGSRVRDAMSPRPVTIEVDDSLNEAVRIMGQYQINRLPVVSRGVLEGIITRTDALKAVAERLATPAPRALMIAPVALGTGLTPRELATTGPPDH